ncbi:MAG TPA: FkbM family methyltransferase [Solirubrobacteraceae bacterium]|jgi:FkbM family methyltransferase|nr:FkbM family methyltransferase [Solirubrobacteraceae bacterium]
MRLVDWVHVLRRRVSGSLAGGKQAESFTTQSFRSTKDASFTLPPDAPASVVASNEHGAYCVPQSSLHRPVARTIVDARVWEPKTLDLVRRANASGDIVHAGTFFGDFIPALASSREPGAIVWAFEPNRENYRCARITIDLNGLQNVVLTHAGLSQRSETALLATSDRRGVALGGGSQLIPDPAGAEGLSYEQVNLVAIDDVVPGDRRVAAIQLDVEGHEQAALAGAMRTIERCRPLIVLETLPAESWVAEQLAPLGYRVAETIDANTVVRPS